MMSGRWTAMRAVTLPRFVIVLGCGLLLGSAGDVGAQDFAYPPAPPRFLVDTPTAGLVPEGAFETRARAFPGGGLALRVDVGLLEWLSIGGGFGGMKIIGDGEPDWYPEPGFSLKLRLIQEDFVYPAFAVGLDTHGSGYYDEQLHRFQYKSRGLYAVLSKNYDWYGDLTLHGGISRSLEEEDDPNATPFVGIEKSLGAVLGLGVEYDLASNDNRDDGAYGRGRGYLNTALRWHVAPPMEVRFVIRDMLKNTETFDPRFSDVIVDEGWGREFSLSYVERF
jgi:hypothetical protein